LHYPDEEDGGISERGRLLNMDEDGLRWRTVGLAHRMDYEKSCVCFGSGSGE